MDEVEKNEDLPWGFHDALLSAMHVDWLHHRLIIELRPKVSERQELDRGARIAVQGLVWMVVDEPGEGAMAAYVPSLVGGYDIDSREGVARQGLPSAPEGSFTHYFFLVERNSFVHFCARDASFEWTEAAPSRCGGRGALFPGDEIPDR